MKILTNTLPLHVEVAIKKGLEGSPKYISGSPIASAGFLCEDVTNETSLR